MHVSPASGRFASTPLPGLCARPHFAPPRPVPNSWLSHCTEIKFQSMQVSLKHAALERIICDQQYDYVAQFTNEHQSLCSFAALILERIIHYIPVYIPYASCTTYQFQKNLSNQINRCGPTLHAYLQLSRSRRCSSQQKTQVLN